MSQMETIDKIIVKIERHIPELEAERKRLNKRSAGVKVIGFVFLLFILPLLAYLLGGKFIPFFAFIGLIIGVGIFFMAKEGFDLFKDRFKRRIINTIVKEFNPNLNYTPGGHIKKSEYFQSKLFNKNPDIYKGEDYLSGRLNTTDFKMSELHTMYEVKNKNGKTKHTIFQGLFMVADFHKYFHSETYILPETMWQSIGLHKKKHEGADLIRMENEAFERKFRVFSTSDQDARFILSPSMMERILELQTKYGNEISLSFRGTNVYIALSTNLNFFEHNMSKPVNEKTLIYGHIEDLKEMLATIDELNLNTRIWSKMPGHISLNKEGI